MKKRILALILTPTLCLSLLPVPILAADADSGASEVMTGAVPETEVPPESTDADIRFDECDRGEKESARIM